MDNGKENRKQERLARYAPFFDELRRCLENGGEELTSFAVNITGSGADQLGRVEVSFTRMLVRKAVLHEDTYDPDKDFPVDKDGKVPLS